MKNTDKNKTAPNRSTAPTTFKRVLCVALLGLTLSQPAFADVYSFRFASKGLVAPEIAPAHGFAVFTESGNFIVPATASAVEVLVVAGGGPGGGYVGGGGGGGGLIHQASYAVTLGAIVPVVVGAGGLPGAIKGGDSSFGPVVAIGGGAGAHQATSLPQVGGSGGGGTYAFPNYTGVNFGAAGTANQGYAGGRGYNGAVYAAAGGGGGAGGAGGDYSAQGRQAGDGGPGLAFDISGVSTYYAGGGGGAGYHGSVAGAGAIGGGGTGTAISYALGTPGVANTGGGGGGGGDYTHDNGSAGGSGIVIVRW